MMSSEFFDQSKKKNLQIFFLTLLLQNNQRIAVQFSLVGKNIQTGPILSELNA